MKTILTILGAMLLGAHVVQAQQTATHHVLSLREAVDLSLQSHPLLKASEENLRAAEFRVDQVRAGVLPQLYFNTSYTRWDWVLPNKKIFLGNSLNDLYAEFTVQQLVYNGGKTGIQTDIAQTLVATETITQQRLQQAIVYSVARAYFTLLKTQRIVAVQELAIANLRDHLTTAKLLYRSGRVSELDVLRAQTQVALASEELVKAKNSVTVRRDELLGAVGVDTLHEFTPLDFVDELWQREQNRPVREDSLLALLSSHPELQRADLDIQVREQEISLARADYYPTALVRGSYNWEDSRIFPGHKDWNVGVGLSFPIFQGGVTKASVEQAKARTEAAYANREALRQRLDVGVRTSLTNLEDTRSRVRSAEEIVRLAEESEKVAALKYKTGKGTNLDVLDAETVLTNARINYVQVLTDFAIARAELMFNLGSNEPPY